MRNNLSMCALTVKSGLVCALLMGGCARQNATGRLTADQWREDLEFVVRELPARHMNVFHSVTRQEFNAAAANLASSINGLAEDQILVELMKLVALVGDGHTHLDLPPSWPRIPIELAWFGDELRVVVADARYDAALGSVLMGVGGVPIDSVIRSLSSLVPRGENHGRTRFTSTMLLAYPRLLHGLGLSRSADEVLFTLRTDTGSPLAMTVRPIGRSTQSELRFAARRAPLWLERLGEQWWTRVFPGSRTIYLAFRQYAPAPEFRERTNALARQIDESGARRIIVDLRLNGGGDFELGRQVLLPVLRERRHVNVYVITGPGTFSAAMVNALDMRRNVGAILVGEPTGARPNSYSEHGEAHLPNSDLRISFSTHVYRFAADGDTAVIPDHHVEPDWTLFRSGRDPVMEWILAQPLR